MLCSHVIMAGEVQKLSAIGMCLVLYTLKYVVKIVLCFIKISNALNVGFFYVSKKIDCNYLLIARYREGCRIDLYKGNCTIIIPVR